MSSATSELGVLLLADARLPTGGHAQSGGLEPALLAGMPTDHVPTYLATRLRTTATVDAATAVVALHALTGGTSLQPVINAWAARTPSDVVRAASTELGRGYARLAGDAARRDPRPVALARVAFAWGVAAADLARVCCHDEIQSVAAAALKLAPLDPATTVRWALDLAPLVEQIVASICRPAPLTEPVDIPAPTAPAAELWAHAHGTAPRRLFSA